LNQEKKKTQLL